VTTRLALILGALILLSIGIDLSTNGGQVWLFLLKKFMELINWVIFWR